MSMSVCLLNAILLSKIQLIFNKLLNIFTHVLKAGKFFYFFLSFFNKRKKYLFKFFYKSLNFFALI